MKQLNNGEQRMTHLEIVMVLLMWLPPTERRAAIKQLIKRLEQLNQH